MLGCVLRYLSIELCRLLCLGNAKAEYFDDLLRVTNGKTDTDLARCMIRQSKELLGWMGEQGVRWQPALGGALGLGRTNSFFLGGGRAMLNALYRTAETLDVDIWYESEVVDMLISDGLFRSVDVCHKGHRYNVVAGALVAAAGGFESNIDWL
jgi:tricarballylate dehydrogenase